MSAVQRAREKQTKHVRGEPLLLSLAGAPPQTSSLSLHAKVWPALQLEIKLTGPECPKVKMTHSADLRSANKQSGDLSEAHKHDFQLTR